jgi:glycosyltransferase involved in cell wall biosynthesis
MHIGFFVPRCTPDNSHGHYVIELAKRLAREYEVTVYSATIWRPLRSAVQWHFLPIPNRPAAARLATLWTTSIIANRRRPVDIVHVQGADSPVGNVVTAHCCNAAMQAATDGFGTITRNLNYALGVAVERHCFTKSSTRKVIAVSNKVKVEIQDHYGLDADRITVIPNGVDSGVFHPSHRADMGLQVRKDLGLSAAEFVALFVGGDYRLKGLVPLLRGASHVPGVRVVAVGLKPDSYLMQLVRECELEGRVTFLDKATDMASVYASADCFVLPTRYDTFSLATLEAMASGLPVIVSREAGVTELLTSGRDSLLLDQPDDVEAIASHLSRLVQDAGLCASLGTEARRTAERHSWDDVALRTAEVYRQVLARS